MDGGARRIDSLTLGLLFLVLPAALIYLLARTGGWVRAGWFILFMVAHGGLTCLSFFALWGWLAAYE